LFEPQEVAVVWREERAGGFPFDDAFADGSVGEDRRASGIAEKASADEDARIVVEKKRRATDFNTDGEDVFATTGCQQSLSGREIRQGRATSLADEIEVEDIGSEAEPFANVAGEAGAEVTRASADDEGVDLFSVCAGIGEGAFGGLGGEERGVFDVTGVKSVGGNIESFIDTVENKVARDDAVVAGEDFFDDGAGAGVKLPAEFGGRKNVPTFLLGESVLGGGCS
jgi:hypothetical protein